jgi:integrase
VFGGWRIGSINTPAIRTYIEGRQKDGAAIVSVNRELAILKRAFKLALQDGRMLGMPHIPMLQESNARSGFFERDQFLAVRDRLPASVRGVVTFAYVTRWRIQSEVLKLTWSQVGFKAGVVRLSPARRSPGRVEPSRSPRSLSCSRSWKSRSSAPRPRSGNRGASSRPCSIAAVSP